MAKLFNDAGVTVVCAFISPFERDRQQAREVIGSERFIEVFMDTPIEVCEKRDPHGLYRKARAGEIAEFTGINSPYEAPQKPDVTIDSTTTTVDAAVELLAKVV